MHIFLNKMRTRDFFSILEKHQIGQERQVKITSSKCTLLWGECKYRLCFLLQNTVELVLEHGFQPDDAPEGWIPLANVLTHYSRESRSTPTLAGPRKTRDTICEIPLGFHYPPWIAWTVVSVCPKMISCFMQFLQDLTVDGLPEISWGHPQSRGCFRSGMCWLSNLTVLPNRLLCRCLPRTASLWGQRVFSPGRFWPGIGNGILKFWHEITDRVCNAV